MTGAPGTVEPRQLKELHIRQAMTTDATTSETQDRDRRRRHDAGRCPSWTIRSMPRRSSRRDDLIAAVRTQRGMAGGGAAGCLRPGLRRRPDRRAGAERARPRRVRTGPASTRRCGRSRSTTSAAASFPGPSAARTPCWWPSNWPRAAFASSWAWPRPAGSTRRFPFPAIVVASRAIRDEGTSYHYLPPGESVDGWPGADDVPRGGARTAGHDRPASAQSGRPTPLTARPPSRLNDTGTTASWPSRCRRRRCSPFRPVAGFPVGLVAHLTNAPDHQRPDLRQGLAGRPAADLPGDLPGRPAPCFGRVRQARMKTSLPSSPGRFPPRTQPSRTSRCDQQTPSRAVRFWEGWPPARSPCRRSCPARVFGPDDKAAPSERITVGFIGCGKMANDYHLPELLGFGDVQALAVCEVDRKRREHAKRRVEKAYSEKKEYKGCATYVRLPRARSAARTSTRSASPRPSTGTRSRPSRP